MQILVINSGSSSIKFSQYVTEDGGVGPLLMLDGEVSGIGTGSGRLAARQADGGKNEEREIEAADATAAVGFAFEAVSGGGLPRVEAVGYRVVHPGPRLKGHQRVTDEVLRELEMAAEFAPLHDPEAVKVIREGMRRFPDVAHYACFDTVFHDAMPEEASVYPIPTRFRDAGVRRYGFHGLSCESVVRQFVGGVPKRMVIAHLGSGCSVTAVVDGRSVDTTMGLTPTGGVVMGTRPGDLDPGLMVYLVRQVGVDEVEKMLNHEAGLVALTGMANDLKAVRKAADGDKRARLGLKVFTRSVTKAVGGFFALLGGLDAVVFTGGIGEHDAVSRAEILEGLGGMGVIVNAGLNLCRADDMRAIHASDSRTAIFVVPAQEDLMIAVHVDRMAHSSSAA